jgi:hypothetical protein
MAVGGLARESPCRPCITALSASTEGRFDEISSGSTGRLGREPQCSAGLSEQQYDINQRCRMQPDGHRIEQRTHGSAVRRPRRYREGCAGMCERDCWGDSVESSMELARLEMETGYQHSPRRESPARGAAEASQSCPVRRRRGHTRRGIGGNGDDRGCSLALACVLRVSGKQTRSRCQAVPRPAFPVGCGPSPIARSVAQDSMALVWTTIGVAIARCEPATTVVVPRSLQSEFRMLVANHAPQTPRPPNAIE